ncbi:MAG: PAS domain-containing protein [Gallionella sp.]|nr:PAS domain-containing protein [Gallionella sp.]
MISKPFDLEKPSASVIKWLAVTVLLVNLFVILLAVLWLNHSKQQDQEDAAVATRNMSNLLEQHLIDAFEKIDISLLAAVDEIDRQNAKGSVDAQAINAFLTKLKTRLPDVLSLRVADAQGAVRYGIGVTPNTRVNVADREYFLAQRNNPNAGRVIARPVLARIDKKWVVIVSRAIHLPDGSFGGVVYANIALEQLSKIFTALDIGENGVIALRDREFGLIVRHPEPQSIDASLGNKTVSGKFFELIQAGKTSGTYIATIPIDDIERVVSFRKPASLPYYIIVGLSAEDFLDEWRQEMLRVAAMLAFFLLVTLWLSWLFYRAWQRLIAATVALAGQKDTLRIVADYTYDWEYWQGVNREILYMNPSCEQITGYSQIEFVATPDLLESIVHPDDQHLAQSHIAGFESREDDNVDFRIVRRDGEIRWIAHVCRPVYGVDGQFMGRRVSNRDITDRVQAEVEFRTILQTTADGFWLVSARNGLLVDVNAAYCNMAGYSREELLNQPITLIEAEQDQEKIERNIQTIMRGEPLLFETRHRHKDGHLIDVEISARFLPARGGVIVTFIRDITGRKQAEKALLTQKDRLNEAQRIAHVGSWELDLADNKLNWSDEIFRIFEIDSDQFNASYEVFLERIHPDDRDRVNVAFMQSVSQHIPYEVIHRLLMADGRVKHVQERGYSVYNEQGIAQRSMGTVQDITERMLAEVALKNSEERLAIATRAGIIGIWDWDVVDNQLVWDEAMYRLYGLRMGDFAGAYEAWASTIHPEDKARTEDDIQAALRGEREYTPEFRVIWPDGSIHYLKAASLTQFDEAGKPLRMIGINVDQTEQKVAEQKIAELLEFNGKIISESTLGIVVYKASGDCVIANTAAARIIGATVEQMRAQNFRHIRSWEKSGMLDAANKALETGENQHSETHLVTSYGKDVWLDFDLIKLIREGEPHLLLILTDVSEFKNTELALSSAKLEAENANRAKSEFLANMSHEIRTPMNAIIGLSDLALGTGELPPRLHNYLDKIHLSSKALLSIINDILDYSKVEAGRLELDQTELRLDDLLENVTDLFNVRAEEKGIELVLHIAPDIPERVLGDSLRLGQVMNNLVGNAVKFTEHGQIVIKVEQRALADGISTLNFSVSDTGIGMSQEQMLRLFKAFTQADSSITRRFGGTGLGLTISKRLVEKMGGDIVVNSEAGKGSTFSFTIALPVSGQARIEHSPSALRGMRALVVDDLEISRLTLRELLGSWQFQVTEAASGQEALALIEQRAHDPEQAFELVLLDWKMPGMSGVEVARRIRESGQNKQTARLPVIIMVTAHSKEILLQEAQGIHLDAVLNKPVTSSSLFDTIMDFQGGHKHPRDVKSSADIIGDTSSIRGARILLAEDNETNQLVATDILERMGLDVTVANNGRQALEILQQADFDAVLMDLQMPVMDGLEAARRIRQEERWNGLPVIAMTAAVMEQDRAACIAAGMNDHVAKPIAQQELLHALLRWIKPTFQTPVVRGSSKGVKNLCGVSQQVGLAESLPGFDVPAALDRLAGNSELLIELLRKFAIEFSDAQAELSRLVREGNLKACAAFVHRIKGAAANLGAMELSQASEVLEQALKAGSAVIDTGVFDLALSHTINSISCLNQPAKTILVAAEYDCDICNWQRASLLVKQIRTLVENYEFVPFELMDELKHAVGCGPLQERLKELERALDRTDYDKAKLALENLPCTEGHFHE